MGVVGWGAWDGLGTVRPSRLVRFLQCDYSPAMGVLAPSAGITVFPSVTNFLLFHTAALPAAELVQRCRAHDVWLRDCDSLSPRFAGRFVRTAVKDEAANARIAAAVADALSGR